MKTESPKTLNLMPEESERRVKAAISIGIVGPFGAEGPIISAGGALGSFCGQTLQITAHERKVLPLPAPILPYWIAGPGDWWVSFPNTTSYRYLNSGCTKTATSHGTYLCFRLRVELSARKRECFSIGRMALKRVRQPTG